MEKTMSSLQVKAIKEAIRLLKDAESNKNPSAIGAKMTELGIDGEVGTKLHRWAYQDANDRLGGLFQAIEWLETVIE